LVDVDDLALLVHREVHGVPGLGVQPGQVRVGDVAHVQRLHRLLGQGEQPGAQPVALVGLAVDHAVLAHGAQQPQRGRLVHAEPGGHLLQPGGPLGEERQDGQGAVDGLAHGVRAFPAGVPAPAVQPGPRCSLPQSSSGSAASSPACSREGGAARSPGTVSAAAAKRWPWRSRSSGGRPRSVAERNPAANASPAPTGAATSTRAAGANSPPGVCGVNAVAPAGPSLTTSTGGSGSAARTAAGPPATPQAASASSSPTNTTSQPRARSSRTSGPAGAPGHSPVR